MHKIKLQDGVFTTSGREFQVEPMMSNFRRRCYMKSAQSFGATLAETLKSLHGMITGRLPKGVLYAFPTNDEVREFSQSYFGPLIANNRLAIGKFVKNKKGSTDTVSLKQVSNANLFLRGARLSQKVGDSAESTSSKTAGFSVDKCVFDEVDYMDVDVIEKFKGRMGDSFVKEEVYLGNPSHEDFGIDLIFKSSDQRFWWRKCTCGAWTCAEKSFPQCVKIRSNGTGYIGCDKCGKEVPMWAGADNNGENPTGKWVADYPTKSDYMHGYMASQLMSLRNDPAEILEDFSNPPHGNLADVYRLRLGRAYSNRDEKLQKHRVLACCGNEAPARYYPRRGESGGTAMGVDIGKREHYLVIGIKTAHERYEIIRACKVTSKQEIYDYARMYGVKSDVLDAGPEFDLVGEYQKISNHKTFLCEYSDTQAVETKFNENTGIVKAARTAIFDRTHRLIVEGAIKLPRQCPEIDEFARQCCNCAKFEEKDKRKGTIVYRYRPTGDGADHFRNALNYFVLAASGHRLAVAPTHRRNSTVETELVSEYQRV